MRTAVGRHCTLGGAWSQRAQAEAWPLLGAGRPCSPRRQAPQQ